MSTGITKTGYSTVYGGAKGYINLGGWNTTLTDVCNTAKETIGITRQEGANEYMYVQVGTATASAGNFLTLSTGYTDTNTIIAPFGMTANGVAATGILAKGMLVAGTVQSGPIYAWMLTKGYATGYMMADSGLAWKAYVCPSTTTANLLDGAPTAATAVGQNLGVTVATATAVFSGTIALSEGVLIYWQFKSLGGVYTN